MDSFVSNWEMIFFSLFTPCAYIIPTYLTVEFIWQHILFICIICPSDLYCSLMEKQPQQMFIVTVTSPPLRCFFSELHKLPVGNNTDINKLLHWSQTEAKLKPNWSQTEVKLKSNCSSIHLKLLCFDHQMHHEEVHIEMLEYNQWINTNNLEVNSAVKYFPYLHEPKYNLSLHLHLSTLC